MHQGWIPTKYRTNRLAQLEVFRSLVPLAGRTISRKKKHTRDSPQICESEMSLELPAFKQPSGLPARYQIRRLTCEHVEWACAIVAHSHAFHGTIFAVCMQGNHAEIFNKAVAALRYLVEHQINSNLSYGVFDLEYKYKCPESAATNGKFYFDPKDNSLSGDQVLATMDFPLVSVALSYDGVNPLDHEKLGPLMSVLPLFAPIIGALDKFDARDASWKATRSGQVLMRNGTSTRHDYEGKGLMATMARWLMGEADKMGYGAISIEGFNDAVTHVWAEPPAPYTAEIVAQFRCDEFECEDEAQGVVKPFLPSKQRVTRIYIRLRT